MKPSEDLIERMKADDRYQKMIDAAPPETRAKIMGAVESFLKELGEGLDGLEERLKDPEIKKKYQDELTRRYKKDRGVKK